MLRVFKPPVLSFIVTIFFLSTISQATEYIGGADKLAWTEIQHSILANVLYVKETRYLQGFEQNVDFNEAGYKYWLIVIDAGTTKPTTAYGVDIGTVLLTKELGKTTVSKGWHGINDELDIELKSGRWYVIGIATQNTASKTWHYSAMVANDFGWGEWRSIYFLDDTNPPDEVFNYVVDGWSLLTNVKIYVTTKSLDSTPPVTTITLNPLTPDGNNNWYKKDVEIALACSDDKTGCKETLYCIDSSNLCSPNLMYNSLDKPKISSEGINYVRYHSKDMVGNIETVKSTTVKIDKTNPIASVTGAPMNWVSTDQTAIVACSDAVSGCDTTKYMYKILTISQACPTDKILYTTGTSVQVTEHSWVCSYVEDNASNADVSDIVEFQIDKTEPTVSVSHSPDVITEDVDVTIKAEATDSLSGIKEIKIYVDGQLKQTCTLSPCLHTSKYSGGVHEYYAESIDKADNTATTTQQSFKVTLPETITLKKGWNLIGVPYKTFNFVSSTCELGERNFYHYDPAMKWEFVRDIKDVQGGKGYWIYSKKECEIKFTGNKEVLSNDIVLTTGWNQIGSTATEPNFQSIKGGCTIQTILYYEPLTEDWKILTENNKLEKYKAYFVKATC